MLFVLFMTSIYSRRRKLWAHTAFSKETPFQFPPHKNEIISTTAEVFASHAEVISTHYVSVLLESCLLLTAAAAFELKYAQSAEAVGIFFRVNPFLRRSTRDDRLLRCSGVCFRQNTPTLT
jgi:hypothetical protein